METFNIFVQAMYNVNSNAKNMEHLLDKEIGLLEIRDQNSRTLLHHACESGRFDYTELLTSNKSDVNVKDDTLITPLLFTIELWCVHAYFYGQLNAH